VDVDAWRGKGKTTTMRMTRNRWVALTAALLLLCLVAGGLAITYLAQTIPGVARLLRGAPPAPTVMPISERDLASLLPTATLTPTPTLPPTEAPPSPTLTEAPPSPTPFPSSTAASPLFTDPAEPAETEPAMPTPTPPPTDTPTPEPTREPPTPTRPAPTATPRPQWIVFESSRGEYSDYEIVVMAPDGSRQANLTQSWADDVAPAWAPDGRHIAFISYRHSVTGRWSLEKGSVYIMDFDPVSGKSQQVWRLTDDGGADNWPTWSPDGRRIAFQSNRHGNWDIWIIGVDGTGLVKLTHYPGNDRHPNWSPDGTRIAFTSDRGGSEDIWVLNVQAALQRGDDSMAVQVTSSPNRIRYPIWSPDGQRFTVNIREGSDQELYIINSDGSNPINVSQSPNSTEGLADWSPDGKRLVFYSDRSGNKEVYLLDLDTLGWTNISNHPADDEFCAWSP
jgi:Tol biopolymer transport system component